MEEQFKNICMLALETRETVTMSGIRTIINYKTPEWFITEVGSFFFEHREAIARGDIDYFLTFDFSKQRQQWGFLGVLADALIDELRAMASAIDRETLHKLSKKLLGLYCNYKLVKQ